MPKLILTFLLFLAAFSINAQTKDSTYKVSHDSAYKIFKIVTQVKKVPIVDQTTHDSTFSGISYNTYKITHDTSVYSCKTVWLFFNSCKYRTQEVMHDTIIGVPILIKTSTTHDTVKYTTVIDTIGFSPYDTTVRVIHDTTVKISIKQVMYVGVKFQQANIREQVQQADDLNTDAARPNSVAVTGNNPLDDGNAAEWKADGFKTWVNVAWYENPNAKPYNFLQPADRQKWASGFETLCQKLKGNADGVAIENEPANGVYFQFPNGWLENYIEQLKIAIPIARKYGIKISDGSIPIEDVELIMNGQAKKERTKRVKALMDAYKALDLDYVLFHAHYKSTDGRNPVKDLPKTIKYLSDYTGKKVFSNELSMEGATGAVITWFLQGSYDAGCHYTIFWSGDGGSGNSKGDAITTTNDLGKAIIQWQNQH